MTLLICIHLEVGDSIASPRERHVFPPCFLPILGRASDRFHDAGLRAAADQQQPLSPVLDGSERREERPLWR